MTALNISHNDPFESVRDNTIEQVAKGQRVMQALQRMYERKLIMQIKENKRASNLSKTEKPGILKSSSSQPWIQCRKTN